MSMFLYSSTETAFASNGLGSMVDAVEAQVYEELNGQFELTVRYPVTGRLFDKIELDGYITARPGPGRALQPFRIYRITRPMGGIVTIYGRHLAYNLTKYVIMGFWSASAAGAINLLNTGGYIRPENCPFTFWTNVEKEAVLINGVPQAVWTVMGSGKGCVLDVYGGEYEFDGYNVNLHQQRGADRGLTIRYGKNLRNFQMDENIANMYNGIVPYYWKDGVAVHIDGWQLMAEGSWTEAKLMPVDLTDWFDAEPTPEMLLVAAQLWLAENGIGVPETSMTLDFIQLSQTEEYKSLAVSERVELGDTVHVYYPQLKVTAAARVVATRYNPILDRYKAVTLGSIKPTLATTIAKGSRSIYALQHPGGLAQGATAE